MALFALAVLPSASGQRRCESGAAPPAAIVAPPDVDPSAITHSVPQGPCTASLWLNAVHVRISSSSGKSCVTAVEICLLYTSPSPRDS